MARAERVAVLVDGAHYFAALREALERAEHSVLVLAWDFDGTLVLDPLGDGPASLPLREYLPALVERRPGLHVRVLVWRYSLFYGEALHGALPDLSWTDRPRLDVRYASELRLTAAHHEKLVVVDDRVAFCGGMDLTAGRWDATSHAPDHPGRVDARGERYAPKHDVQLAVAGEVAACLAELARGRWHEATGETLAPVGRRGGGVRGGGASVGESDPWPDAARVLLRDVPVGIARTLPPYGVRREVREVEALTLDALASARERIYVETQYFTARAVGDLLERLLARPDAPEVVVVVRRRADGVVQRHAMGENRTRLLRRLAAADLRGRLRVVFPVARDDAGREEDVNVHSKLIAVDDRFLRVGSSNLNNRSTGFDTECDLAVEVARPEHEAALRSVVCRLLAEHLGRDPSEVGAVLARRGSLHDVLDAFPVGGRRALREVVPDPGPAEPLPGTGWVDPDRAGPPASLRLRRLRRRMREGVRELRGAWRALFPPALDPPPAPLDEARDDGGRGRR